MGKFFGALLFFGTLGFVGWMIYASSTGRDLLDAPITVEGGNDLRLADTGENAARDLDAVLEDAVRNARRAEALAVELEEASQSAYEAATSVSTIAVSNRAAANSRATTVAAAQTADRTAALMRNYSEELLARLNEAESLANEAEEAAALVASIEDTRREAVRAARRAEEANRERLEALREAELTEEAAEQNLPVTPVVDPGVVDDGPEAIIVVPIEEAPPADNDGRTAPY